MHVHIVSLIGTVIASYITCMPPKSWEDWTLKKEMSLCTCKISCNQFLILTGNGRVMVNRAPSLVSTSMQSFWTIQRLCNGSPKNGDMSQFYSHINICSIIVIIACRFLRQWEYIYDKVRHKVPVPLGSHPPKSQCPRFKQQSTFSEFT